MIGNIHHLLSSLNKHVTWLHMIQYGTLCYPWPGNESSFGGFLENIGVKETPQRTTKNIKIQNVDLAMQMNHQKLMV